MYARIKNMVKKIRLTRLVIQLSVLILVIFFIRSCQLAGTVSGEAPIIKGELLSGEMVDLRQYRGRPVLVHFWATWCPVCKLQNSNIDAVAKDYAVISVAYWPESEAEIVQFMHDEKLTMPVIVDSVGELGKLYGIRGVPVSFILDPDGNIKFSEFGYTTEIGLRLRLWWAGK
jgi:thiol-disulfide isomerase/thioredoxin